eukprot:5215873-Pleurochrysis_carterae.AAC.1
MASRMHTRRVHTPRENLALAPLHPSECSSFWQALHKTLYGMRRSSPFRPCAARLLESILARSTYMTLTCGVCCIRSQSKSNLSAWSTLPTTPFSDSAASM